VQAAQRTPLTDDNVLYHSLLELASWKGFGASFERLADDTTEGSPAIPKTPYLQRR
jgi:hypothetical protein